MKTVGWIWLIGGAIVAIGELSFGGGRIGWVIFNCSEMITGAILLVVSKIK